ncbi:hypothetical protein [cf. Phormidesmis sp. LEGE 11477]|uniref:hypothetical protein n=1 Tax=cf. Phormidesmis sp. LEGE 11477 TaxID=1828680 RepID=UPI001880336F|nr:hypothetical protein [cf. Phormidesmis sp. LEGE 11477]MBE9059589.1 hypothetical protein [cf. Phormidesmis sp. LEGE 11477]
MLSINLDDETEGYLAEILQAEKITVSELLKQVLRVGEASPKENRLNNHRSKQTVLERMGGVPEAVLSASGLPDDLSDRDTRKAIITEHVQARHKARHE